MPNCSKSVCRLATGGLAALALALYAPNALATPAVYAGASADGESVFFTTTEKLVPGDTDNKRDVYERFYDAEPGVESYVTREVSTGPVGGNDSYDVSFDGVSQNGLKVFFSTAEALVAEDRDLADDIYVRNLTTGVTSLVSKADPSCPQPGCGEGSSPASFDAVSADGSRVVFSTDEVLAAGDGDSSEDVYVRSLPGGPTTLVSAAAASCGEPECGDHEAAAFFDGASADAETIVFGTDEPLSGADTDSAEDIYVRDLGAATTELASTAGTCPAGLGPGECTPIFGGVSSDGSHVFFETGEGVAAGQDTDKSQDVYGWSGGAPVLVSTSAGGGNGAGNATYEGATADGSGVFFETAEALTADDEDTSVDLFLRSGGLTSLVSTGPTDGPAGAPANFAHTSPDGEAVAFTTTEALTGEDTDTSRDVYSRDTVAGTTALLSRPGAGCTGGCGNGPADAGFAGASSDGSGVFFETTEPLVGADTDSSPDVYERSGSGTSLVSTGPMSKNAASSPHLADVSEAGNHALFSTDERLTIDDLDAEADVYDRSPAGTLLISTANPDQLVLGPATPILSATSPASPAPSTEPRVLGEADPGTSIKLYATSDCSGAPVATGSGVELEAGGIAVSVAPGSTTTFHATATLFNDTSACSAGLTYQQVAGGGGGGGGGGGEEGGEGGSGGEHHPETITFGPQPLVPHTRITFAPGSRTSLRRPTFQFLDATGQSGTRFECAVDRDRWRSCSSPTRLKKLARGRHVFKVKGVNSGLWEQKPVTRAFKVVGR